MLGPLQITAAGREIGTGLRKARELLAFLAVHPDGASGEAISEALWPGSDPGRAAGQRNLALRKAREMLRTAAALPAPMWILTASGRYRLDPALIGTDLEAFSQALEAARNASGDARLAACRRAVALYRGELAEGTGYEWAEPYAEAARRRALDAWTAIAEILQPRDPDQALSALETALAHDPYNEYLYLRIMRLQAAAGRPEAVRRTLALLESRLAELRSRPAPAPGSSPPPSWAPQNHPAAAAARQRSRAAHHPAPPATALMAVTHDHASGGNRETCPRRDAAGRRRRRAQRRCPQRPASRKTAGTVPPEAGPAARKQDKTSAKREGGRNAARQEMAQQPDSGNPARCRPPRQSEPNPGQPVPASAISRSFSRSDTGSFT